MPLLYSGLPLKPAFVSSGGDETKAIRSRKLRTNL
jgi:hypothetical protein